MIFIYAFHFVTRLAVKNALMKKTIGKYWIQYFFRGSVLKIKYFFTKKILDLILANILFHKGALWV